MSVSTPSVQHRGHGRLVISDDVTSASRQPRSTAVHALSDDQVQQPDDYELPTKRQKRWMGDFEEAQPMGGQSSYGGTSEGNDGRTWDYVGSGTTSTFVNQIERAPSSCLLPRVDPSTVRPTLPVHHGFRDPANSAQAHLEDPGEASGVPGHFCTDEGNLSPVVDESESDWGVWFDKFC